MKNKKIWSNVRKCFPWIYVTVEWFTLGLSLVAAVLAGLNVWTSALA